MIHYFAIISIIAVIGATGYNVVKIEAEKTQRVASQTMPMLDKPIVEGSLKGCVASRQNLYEANGDERASLWVVRCPNSTTTTTWNTGKNSVALVTTSE